MDHGLAENIMAMEAVHQSPPAADAFPTPSATPNRQPSIHARADSSPGPVASPVSLPNHITSPDGRSEYEDTADEDVISPLDPRRFTPTLHASLVSEILALRRDAESQSKTIDALENSLDESRIENDELNERMTQQSKESRSLKHQLQLLEGGSSSALTELAKERDNALDGMSEVRRKFEQAQKKSKNREEELERTTKLWTRDKETWDCERRNLERKVHVVEGRLKVVLNEVASTQAAGSLEPALHEAQDAVKEASTGKDSDSVSIYSSSQGPRRTSITSLSSAGSHDGGNRDGRFSVMSAANMLGSHTNLADELAFDEEDEFDLDDELGRQSPEALPEERPTSVHSQVSHTVGSKARKILGLSLDENADGQGTKLDEVPELRNSLLVRTPRFEYKDSGVQYTPPPSPVLSPTVDKAVQQDAEVQNKPAPAYETKESSTSTLTIDMVSASAQTVDSLPTPPWTPKVEPTPESPVAETTMVSAFVQTEPAAETEIEAGTKLAESDSKSTNVEVPKIEIIPVSEPSSPRGSVVLPPQTKSVSCQADLKPAIETETVGIQTEPIRIDQRPVKLPASLLPSAIPDLPLSTATQDQPVQPYIAPPPRSAKRARGKPLSLVVETPTDTNAQGSLGHIQAYPGNNDNGPLSKESKPNLRRPLRSSSLFAGFEQNNSDDETPEGTRDVFTDDELLNRPFASYKVRRGKLVSADERRRSLEEAMLPDVTEDLDSESRFEEGLGIGLTSPPGSSWSRSGAPGQRQHDIRKAAMISSGAATHMRRARSPSEPSVDSGSGNSTSSAAPPFPVPIRLSSRRFPQVGSDGRQSPTPSRNFSDRPQSNIRRRPTLRRVRSAATMSQTGQNSRPTSRSSPTMSTSSYGQESPRHPRMPFDDIPIPRDGRSSQARPARQSSVMKHERQDSTSTQVQPTSVVDAIAQTMVGEWMWKYVRRRRSFAGERDNLDGRNAEELSASITNSGVRHKRWVWLAPYERSVMWSSKQPTTGPALLGKSGRKCKCFILLVRSPYANMSSGNTIRP